MLLPKESNTAVQKQKGVTFGQNRFFYNGDLLYHVDEYPGSTVLFFFLKK